MTALKDPKKPKQNSKINAYARYSGIAFQMIAVIAIGCYGGVLLDTKFPNKYSVFTLVCSLLSVAMATYYAIRQASNNSENKNE
ncbi:MAG: AtpZ/AtpI family protein [Flavobacteriaceae bacterium]